MTLRPFPADPRSTRSEADLASRRIRGRRFLAQLRVRRLEAAWPEPNAHQVDVIAAARFALEALEEDEARLLESGR